MLAVMGKYSDLSVIYGMMKMGPYTSKWDEEWNPDIARSLWEGNFSKIVVDENGLCVLWLNQIMGEFGDY